MKINPRRMHLLLTACLLFTPSLTWAEDITELKDQIKLLQSQLNTLSAKVADLEQKQATQASEIKKIPLMETKAETAPQPHPEIFNNVKVGGHLELFLFDQSRANGMTKNKATAFPPGSTHSISISRKNSPTGLAWRSPPTPPCLPEPLPVWGRTSPGLPAGRLTPPSIPRS